MRFMLRAATIALAAHSLVASTARAQAATPSTGFRIAFVNTAMLLDNAPGRVEAESLFAKDTRGYRDQLQKLNDSLNTQIAAYQKAEPTLTATQKTTRTTSIQKLQQQLEERNQQLQQQASQRQNELMAPIMERVKRVLDDIRQEDGYAMIITGDPNLILSYDKNLDVTDRVVARLRTLSATTPATSKPGAPVSAPAGVTRKPQ